MTTLDAPMICIVILWLIGMAKTGYDAMGLRSLYVEKIDPSMPASASDMDLSISGQVKQIRKSLKNGFLKVSRSPGSR